MKRVLVTGGAGYIGSHTIIELLSAGYSVISLDNYHNSSPSVYGLINSVVKGDLQYFQVDIRNQKLVLETLEKLGPIDGLIHFAAYKSVNESVGHPLEYYDNNIGGLLNLLKVCDAKQIENFIFSSSCSVYGNISELPVDENTLPAITQSPYAETKWMGERIIKDFSQASSGIFKSVLLRYFNPVGAHTSGTIGEQSKSSPNNLVPIITETAIGKRKEMVVYGSDYPTRDGSCIRDYVHVSDIARAHVLALEYARGKKDSFWDCFNLGTGTGISVLEMIAAFEKVNGVKVNYKISSRREGDVPAIFSNSSKAKGVLNWECNYSLEDMMSSAWLWQQKLIQQEV